MTSEPATARWADTAVVDDDGIRLDADLGEVLDVYFGERRIWSVNPLDFVTGDDFLRSFPWPPRLKPRLHGATEVRIYRHLSHELLVRREVVFAGSAAPLEIVDETGNWLTVTKWGALAPAFVEAGGDERRGLVAAVARLLDDINAGTPLSAFAAYGTLLGAVRSGALLSHDHDADIAYLSDADNPTQLLLQSFSLQRYLRRQGWHVERNPSGFLVVSIQLPGGAPAHIDIFSAHITDGRFYLERWVSARLSRNDVVPLGQIELEGVTLAAPRVPEAVLAATYGPGWLVPDPSFQYKRQHRVATHFNRWVGDAMQSRRWNRYLHSLGGEDLDRRRPSDFADWVLQSLPDGAAVMDLGCGMGLDAHGYAREGHDVLGLDCSSYAIGAAAGATPTHPAAAVAFETVNLLDLRRLLVHGSRFALEHPGPRAVTCRLLLDALSSDLHPHVWWLCRTVLLGTGSSLYLEVRAEDGVPCGHSSDAPWQTLADPRRIADEITEHGGVVEESVALPADRFHDGPDRVGTVRLRARWPAAG